MRIDTFAVGFLLYHYHTVSLLFLLAGRSLVDLAACINEFFCEINIHRRRGTSGRATPWDREARLSSAKSGAAGSATLLLPTTTMSAAVCKMKR